MVFAKRFLGCKPYFKYKYRYKYWKSLLNINVFATAVPGVVPGIETKIKLSMKKKSILKKIPNFV